MGTYEMLDDSVKCYDVAWSPKGHLLVAKKGGVDVVDISKLNEPEVIKSIPFEERAFSIVVHKSFIVVGVVTESHVRTHEEVFILNLEYKEINRWTVGTAICDFAIVNNNIVFSTLETGNLKVYSLRGKLLPDILWEGKSGGILAMEENCFVIANEDSNKVCRKRISNDRCDTVWVADVVRPFAICADANDSLWVRSNRNDCISILSHEGMISTVSTISTCVYVISICYNTRFKTVSSSIATYNGCTSLCRVYQFYLPLQCTMVVPSCAVYTSLIFHCYTQLVVPFCAVYTSFIFHYDVQ